MMPANAGTTGNTSGVGLGLMAVNGDKFCTTRYYDVVGGIDYPAFKSSYPSYGHHIFSTSDENGETASGGDRIFGAGGKSVLKVGEHCVIGLVSGQVCEYSIYFKQAKYMSVIQQLLTNWCAYGPGIETGAVHSTHIMGGNIEAAHVSSTDAYSNLAWWREQTSGAGQVAKVDNGNLSGIIVYKASSAATGVGTTIMRVINITSDLSGGI
jgi:hypothetical protein